MPLASSVARRYAEAYFSLAKDADDIDGWGRELQRATEMLSNPEVAAAIANPRRNALQRTQLALDLLDGSAEPVRNLVRLMIERRRIALLPQVLEHYQRLADRASGVVRALVITAVEPDDALRGAIARALEAGLGTKVKTEVRRDPAILGGVIVKVGDRVIDDSVRTHLQQLQAALA